MPYVHDKETWIFNDDGIVLVYRHSQAGSRNSVTLLLTIEVLLNYDYF